MKLYVLMIICLSVVTEANPYYGRHGYRRRPGHMGHHGFRNGQGGFIVGGRSYMAGGRGYMAGHHGYMARGPGYQAGGQWTGRHGCGGCMMGALPGVCHRYLCNITNDIGEEITYPGIGQDFLCPGCPLAGQRGCPFGGSCSVGPLPVRIGDTEVNAMFCDETDVYGNLMVLHGACRIVLANGREIHRDLYHPDYCTNGPLPGDVTYFGQNADVYFPNHNALLDPFAINTGRSGSAQDRLTQT